MATIQKLTTLLALASLAVIAAGCVKTAVRKDAAAAADTVQAVSATPDIITGTFTDPRDGQAYRTVKIGNFTWMAENLNFATDSSVCYDNADSNCTRYGRLYNWNDAMQACPASWRLPGIEDWDSLAVAAGGLRIMYPGYLDAYDERYWEAAVKKLKSATGWKDWNDEDGGPYSGNGTDELGFSALPGGFRETMFDSFMCIGKHGIWWTAAESEDSRFRTRASRAWGWSLDYDSEGMERYDYWKTMLLSVRCLQGEAAVRKSVAPADAARAAVTPDTVGGILTDLRDGKTYRTVRIGKAVWMAENLNFKTERSACYDNADSNCTKYGRLYNWKDAMKACPAGWRVPSEGDWDTLARDVGGRFNKSYGYWWDAGKKLKSTTGWIDGKDEDGNAISGNGSDEFGFSALPGGSSWQGKFHLAGDIGFWWVYRDDAVYNNAYDEEARLRSMHSGSDHMDDYQHSKQSFFSLRCLQGPAP